MENDNGTAFATTVRPEAIPEVSPMGDNAPAPRGLPLLTIDDILAYVPDPREEIWPDGIMSLGQPIAFIGAPGGGKSRLSMQAALDTILGRDFLGWKTNGRDLKWLFLQTENGLKRLHDDFAAMTRNMGEATKKKIREHLRVLNMDDKDFATICMAEGHQDRGQILVTLEEWRPDIVVVDPLRAAAEGDLNADVDMTLACSDISAVIRQSNPKRVPFIIHHGRTGKKEVCRVFGDDAGSFASNSKVLHGWLRSQINIAAAGDTYP